MAWSRNESRAPARRGGRGRSFAAGLGLLLMAIVPASGQQRIETRPLPAGPEAARPLPPGREGEVVRQAALRQAEEWMRLRLPARAIPLLEPLHQERPTDATIGLLLAEAYAGAGRYGDAVTIYRAEA